jgi:hypothetical protein
MYVKNISEFQVLTLKKGSVRNLMFRFADTLNPNLCLGSGSMIWPNRTSNIRFGSGSNLVRKVRNLTAASLPCERLFLWKIEQTVTIGWWLCDLILSISLSFPPIRFLLLAAHSACDCIAGHLGGYPHFICVVHLDYLVST